MAERGFFEALFDTSFKSFITPKIVRVLFMVMIVFCGLGSLAFVISGFSNGAVAGIVSAVVAPLFFMLMVVYCRIIMESIIVAFSLLENTNVLVEAAKLHQPQLREISERGNFVQPTGSVGGGPGAPHG